MLGHVGVIFLSRDQCEENSVLCGIFMGYNYYVSKNLKFKGCTGKFSKIFNSDI